MLFLFVWFSGIVLISAQFTRETIYHSMNDRGVYLPDDYNSDLPPAQGGPVPVDLRLRVLQIAEINDNSQTMTVEMSVGLTWTEPRLLFNNIFDWESRKLIKTSDQLIQHLWAPNLHFLSTERMEKISTLKNTGTVTIFRNGTVIYDSSIRLTVGTCVMSYQNYPMDSQLCRVLSVSHSNSIHEVVLRGSISYNTEFQRPLQYKLELRHLPDNYTFMVMEDAMYSVQGFEVRLDRRLAPMLTRMYIPTQLLVFTSWLAFFVPPEVVSGRMVLLVTLFLMIINIGISVEKDIPICSNMTAAHIWLLGCHIQILLNLLQFSFLLFTMAQEEKVKEERGRGLPLSLQSLPGSSTVDSVSLRHQAVQAKRKELKEIIIKVDRRSLIVFPIVCLLFNTGYWVHFLVSK
ncbi:glycine receptor subunit beta-type 4 [Eurytemora carolleeae]|uniref:glycine receptor subunit beta-type 4 n=1 Tax=Eurytemora carolleeae TaxID=1294199 RepID=UPI000C76730E|nr:glycine receptor subunit beta-type 4 [Eurytemora carolleeae]|eukprot:XP_023328635.1 glycine receptor subunit beta-type 4-like [Eurytemora affinis]